MKKIISLIIAIVVMLSAMGVAPISVGAAMSGTCGENLTWVLEDGTLTISGTGDMRNFYPYPPFAAEIPWEVDEIEKIIINEGVTSIGAYAFSECDYLVSITIPNTVTSIGDLAFYSCEYLDNITIPDSVMYIDRSAFKDTGIYNDSENWIDGVFYIDNFLICPKDENISGDYEIKEGTTKIAKWAFQYCSNLTNIVIPNTVISIGTGAFRGCSGLTNVSIPESITQIESYTFEDCSGITEMIIPNNVVSIGKRAFDYCDSLESINIPTSVKFIGDYVFGSCTNLKNIFYSGSKGEWKNIEKGSNYLNQVSGVTINYAITGLVVDSGTCGEDVTWTLNDLNVLTISGTGEMENYSESPWDGEWNSDNRIETVIIEEGVTSIGDYAFRNHSYWLKNVIIPNSVKTIGNSAFQNCENLKDIHLPNSVEKMESDAFKYCNLGNVYINDLNSWLNIEFENCESNPLNGGANLYVDGVQVTNIVFPDDLIKINNNVLAGCKLSSVVIPSSVTQIGIDAFANSKIEAVYIDEINTWLNIDFEGATSNPLCCGAVLYVSGIETTEIIIPEGTTEIGDYAFYGYENLENITVSESVETISASAFTDTGIENNDENWDGCVFYVDKHLIKCRDPEKYSLTEYSVREGTISIADAAFIDCGDLEKIIIPDSVKYIGMRAFYACTSLAEIDLGNGVKEIGESAFSDYGWSIGNSDLKELIIPSSVEKIGKCAFYKNANLKISVDINNEYYCSEDGILFDKEKNEIIFYPPSREEVYYKIPNSVKVIQDYAFYSADHLTNVDIGNNVTYIGNYAFMYSCLTELNIPDNVTYIGDWTFSRITELSKLTLGNSVEKIGDGAFEETGLITVDIPDSVKIIGKDAFFQCNSLKHVAIGANVENIGQRAFSCDNLQFIQVDKENRTYYSEDGVVFSKDMDVIHIYPSAKKGVYIIPNGVKKIDKFSFYYSTELTKLFIPKSVDYIEEYAFWGSDLTDIYYEGNRSEWNNIFIGEWNYVDTQWGISYSWEVNVSYNCNALDYIPNIQCSVTENKLTVMYNNIPTGSCVVVNSFDNEDNFTSNIVKSEESMTLTLEGDVKYVKVFVWESIESLRPLCEVVEIDISKK